MEPHDGTRPSVGEVGTCIEPFQLTRSIDAAAPCSRATEDFTPDRHPIIHWGALALALHRHQAQRKPQGQEMKCGCKDNKCTTKGYKLINAQRQAKRT